MGTNTDGEAALKSFKKYFWNYRKKKILLLGPGGAGKAVASYFSNEIINKRNLVIAGRTEISKNFSKQIRAQWINFKKLKKVKFKRLSNCY